MDSRYNIDELRFVTKEEQITEVYVFCRPLDDDCPYVQGWHHEAFPASLPCAEIEAFRRSYPVAAESALTALAAALTWVEMRKEMKA